MDVKEFQNSRQQMLDEFEKDYTYLKTSYSQALLAAIKEPDPAKQDELIRIVLDANSTMSALVREMLVQMNKSQDGFDPKTLDELTADLVKYQQQYQDIQHRKDRYNTLKLIHSDNSAKLASATTMFYVYLSALILLCLIVVFLVIRAGWIQTFVQSAASVFTQRQAAT